MLLLMLVLSCSTFTQTQNIKVIYLSRFFNFLNCPNNFKGEIIEKYIFGANLYYQSKKVNVDYKLNKKI
jgi:hypothetical protein